MKVVIFLLILACAGLGYGLYNFQQQAAQEESARQAREAELEQAKAQLKLTSEDLTEQKQVNAKLQENLDTTSTELKQSSNEIENLKTTLVTTMAKADAEAKAAQEEITRKQGEIQELEGRNANLNNKMTDLTGAITELESLIADTERKLAASEGDREFLLAELKRMQAEKVDLERQFNDLALLRDQIRKLKDELSIASRLEWIRRGLYGPTPAGTEKLQPGFAEPSGQDQVDLDVEIREGGEARVVPVTNAPATTP